MHNWRKNIASWKCGGTLYLSVPFTWLLGEAETMARAYKGKVVAGGPAVKLVGSEWFDETPEETPFDVLSMHNPSATFTTRGCPNRCTFCAVPKIEGALRELKTWKPAPVVCDNNLLAASRKHFSRVIESLRPFPACDFNQGLDARLFTRWHADEIAKLHKPMVRFAFDHAGEESIVATSIEKARKAGLRHFGVYVLLGYDDTPEDALYRLNVIRGLGIWPNPMRYQPLDATEKNAHVAPGWTDHELRRMVRYHSKLRYFEHIPYDEYQYTGDDTPLFATAQQGDTEAGP